MRIGENPRELSAHLGRCVPFLLVYYLPKAMIKESSRGPLKALSLKAPEIVLGSGNNPSQQFQIHYSSAGSR